MADGTQAEQELRAFWRRSVRLAHFIVGTGAIVLYLVLSNGRAAAFGWMLGGWVSVLRFSLYYRALARLKSPASAIRARMLTYVLSGAALAVAFAFQREIWPWTTAPGLLVMNASLVVNELLCKRQALEPRARPADNAQ